MSDICRHEEGTTRLYAVWTGHVRNTEKRFSTTFFGVLPRISASLPDCRLSVIPSNRFNETVPQRDKSEFKKRTTALKRSLCVDNEKKSGGLRLRGPLFSPGVIRHTAVPETGSLP